MNVIKIIKYLDEKERKRRATKQKEQEKEQSRAAEQHKKIEYIYQDFEIFVGANRHIINTRFCVDEPDYYFRNGVMTIDWKIDDLGLRNNNIIQLETTDLKEGLFFISNIVRN